MSVVAEIIKGAAKVASNLVKGGVSESIETLVLPAVPAAQLTANLASRASAPIAQPIHNETLRAMGRLDQHFSGNNGSVSLGSPGGAPAGATPPGGSAPAGANAAQLSQLQNPGLSSALRAQILAQANLPPKTSGNS